MKIEDTDNTGFRKLGRYLFLRRSGHSLSGASRAVGLVATPIIMLYFCTFLFRTSLPHRLVDASDILAPFAVLAYFSAAFVHMAGLSVGFMGELPVDLAVAPIDRRFLIRCALRYHHKWFGGPVALILLWYLCCAVVAYCSGSAAPGVCSCHVSAAVRTPRLAFLAANYVGLYFLFTYAGLFSARFLGHFCPAVVWGGFNVLLAAVTYNLAIFVLAEYIWRLSDMPYTLLALGRGGLLFAELRLLRKFTVEKI